MRAEIANVRYEFTCGCSLECEGIWDGSRNRLCRIHGDTAGDALLARIAILEAALRPFADYADGLDADPNCAAYPDPCPVALRPGGLREADAPTLGDFRAAARLLKERQ